MGQFWEQLIMFAPNLLPKLNPKTCGFYDVTHNAMSWPRDTQLSSAAAAARRVRKSKAVRMPLACRPLRVAGKGLYPVPEEAPPMMFTASSGIPNRN